MNKLHELTKAVEDKRSIKVKVNGRWMPWFGKAISIQNGNLIVMNYDCVDTINIDTIEDWIVA